jgi:malonyl-CoA/methylmalonyl-CoA synthetase
MTEPRNYNLYSRFQQEFNRRPEKIVLTTESGQTLSYADLDRESASLAAYITLLGVGVGDRVTVQVEKSPQALCLYLACLRGGFVYQPLNLAYQRSELAYFLNDASPALVIFDDQNQAMIEPLCKPLEVAHLLSLNANGTGTLTEQWQAWRKQGEPISKRVVLCAKDDLAALLYSSGTTGKPKGIMLSHDNLYQNAAVLVDAWGFTEQDILLHALPIFHVHGLFVALGCVLLSGASMHWQAGFNAQKVARILGKCTVMMGVPTYYTRLLDCREFTQTSVECMRLFVSGSAPLLISTFNEFEARCGHRILERYGMTETNMNTSNPLNGERIPGTVGLPLPGVLVRVVGECGKELSVDQIGDLQVKGNNVFKGYWRMPEKTSEDFTHDGFFNTGDKALIDANGYVSIVGRSKDLVITGGLNVYPKEVELLIDVLDGVKESAVIGVPHPDFGEAVVAVVVADAGVVLLERALIATLTDLVANFKVPKKVVFIDELPRNPMGKVQKNLLRESNASLFKR